MKDKLISVIIPVYNTCNFLERCVESVVANSYKNLEVIIVDDGSTDSSIEIEEKLEKKYENVKVVKHKENSGLFQARITGFENSKGEYISFVDSDDYVSIDWFRMLYVCAEENNADIAIGQFIYDRDNQYQYCNLDPLRQKIELKDENVIKTYMRQQGKFYSWQLIWNKLYKKELWQESLKDLKEFSQKSKKLVMCEDMAFSIALWCRAKKVCNFTTGAEYFYFFHQNQSTNLKVDNKEKNLKSIDNAIMVFDFMRKQLEKKNVFENEKENFNEWEKNYASIYFRDMKNYDYNFYENYISKAFKLDAKEFIKRPANKDFFYNILTVINKEVFSWYTCIKQMLCDKNIKVISFDIFDTLLVRPFLYPTDLFYFLEKDFLKEFDVKSYYEFAQIRIEEEKRIRNIEGLKNNLNEEVTLKQIYDQMAIDYGFDRKKLEKIEKRECELEIKFCYQRKFVKQLYDLARYNGKKIIATSDMYLPKETILAMLKKCGYEVDALYLSSDIGLGKYTTNLFKYIMQNNNNLASEYLHIGDNWQSDVENPVKVGWKSFHIQKTTDIFMGYHPVIYGGNIFNSIKSTGMDVDLLAAEWGFVGYRCAMAIIANKLFDNPMVSYNKNSNFDIDPYVVGYSVLGEYLFAVTDWIRNEVQNTKCSTIHFIARDGYLPMRAFEIFKKYYRNLPNTNYLYASRKSMMVADIYSKSDIFSLTNKLNLFNYSPEKLYNTFKKYLYDKYEKLSVSEFCKLIGVDGKAKSAKFPSKTCFETISSKLANLLDFKKINKAREKLTEYFKQQIKEGDMLFDIGYSGRQETALSQMLGFPVDSLYIHSNSQMLNIRENMFGFKTKLFYDYKPKITGVVREHVFMKLAPSTIGYKEENGKLVPEFEKYKINSDTEIITNTMQEAALEFVEDVLSIFGDYNDILYYRKNDLAYTFEYFLHYSKDLDREILRCLEFEDDLGLGKTVNAVDFWNNELTLMKNATNISLINEDNQNRQESVTMVCDIQQKPPKKPFKRKCLDFFLPKGTRRREFFRKIYCKMTHQIYVKP